MQKLNQLIVMPRIVNQVGDWYQFPLGVAYVSSSLKKAGFNIYTLNLNHKTESIGEILESYINKYNIDIVSTGGLTGQYGAIREVLYHAKRIRSEIITIAGGGIITSDPENAMVALEYADYGVIGEGELISCDLHRALEYGDNFKIVSGGKTFKINQKLKRGKRKTWRGLNKEEIKKRNQKITDKFNNSKLTSNNFANKYQNEFDLKPSQIRTIIRKA